MTPDTYEALASRIDVHLLDPFVSADSVYEACMRARELRVRAVVVRPTDVEQVQHWLQGSGLAVASTAGYPYGASNTGVKLYELRDLLRLGAKEVEFHLSPARLASRQFQHIEAEVLQASKSCHESAARLTAVYSSAHLVDDLKIITTKICRRAEVDTVSVDGGEAELAVMRPLLKDVLQMKLGRPCSTLEETLQAFEAGYSSIAVTDPAPILSAWRAQLQAAPAVS